jgi:hypothetical protein
MSSKSAVILKEINTILNHKTWSEDYKLEKIRDFVNKESKKSSTSTWDLYENVDRQGGSFTQEEINRARDNNW